MIGACMNAIYIGLSKKSIGSLVGWVCSNVARVNVNGTGTTLAVLPHSPILYCFAVSAI